jgi:hypothetical protein
MIEERESNTRGSKQRNKSATTEIELSSARAGPGAVPWAGFGWTVELLSGYPNLQVEPLGRRANQFSSATL